MLTKPQARALAAERRKKSPAEWRAIGLAMAHQLCKLPVWETAAAVFCFVSLPDEPDTEPILRAALCGNKRLFLPRVKGQELTTVPVADLGSLAAGAYGIREPTGPQEALPRDALALIPCLAIDRRGVRLGRGKGYYDRFLAHFTGPRFAICPADLVFAELPQQAHDVVFSLDEILTEYGPLCIQQEAF